MNIKPFPNSPLAHSPVLCLPRTIHSTTFSHNTLYVQCMVFCNVLHYAALHLVTLRCNFAMYYMAIDFFALHTTLHCIEIPCIFTITIFAMHRIRMFQNIIDIVDISNPCGKSVARKDYKLDTSNGVKAFFV